VPAGGLVKKTVLAAGAMTAAAAVCYPREATEISQYAWNVASDFATTTYHDWFDCQCSHYHGFICYTTIVYTVFASLACYKFDAHEPILIILAEMLLRR